MFVEEFGRGILDPGCLGERMVWVIAGLIFLFLMLRFPAFGGIVILLIACGALYLYGQSVQDEARAKKREKIASSPERLAIVHLTDTRLALDGYLSRVQGIATNTSPFLTVQRFQLRVRVYDCPEITLPSCTVVGDSQAEARVTIPPGQKRSFEDILSFPGLPQMKMGDWSWNYSLQQVHAE